MQFEGACNIHKNLSPDPILGQMIQSTFAFFNMTITGNLSSIDFSDPSLCELISMFIEGIPHYLVSWV